jgi:hypothetical protein
MKKNNVFTVLLVLLSFMGNTQAVLPTSWSFTTVNLPTGWTESESNLYSASGNTPPAKKFDTTGDNLIIHFASAPGNLSYYLVGNPVPGGTFSGTFSVEQSDLGLVWTNLHTFTTAPTGYALFTDVPLVSTRYIRFIFTNKISGNIGLDDVGILAGVATPEQEINVKQGVNTVLSGGVQLFNSPLAVTTPTTFTIQNLGISNVLNISSALISGTNASDYSVVSTPNSVSAGGNANLIVNFMPAALGNRNAVLTINSNDTDEAAYIINLYGIGGNFATEPSSQATNLVFSNVKTYRFYAALSPSANSEGHLVLRKKGSPISGAPQDGQVYQRGDIVGDAQVVFSSNASNFVPNNIVAGENYYFAVFSYNGVGSYRNYLTANPLTGYVLTPATMMPSNYYSSLSTSSSNFVASLHALVNPHQQQLYGSYANFMIKNFSVRDTTLDRRVVTCVYSGENKIYTEPFDFSATGYSREHTYCHSWMPTNPAQDLPEYSDYHHLFPTNLNDVNIVRSNNALGIVVNVTSTYLGSKLGTDANGQTVFEPRDEHKGDAARAMMYEAICYTTISGNSWALPNYQNQYLLKQWHFQDPPDNWEIARNDFIDSLQNNRNPFVDSIDYACFVNFSNMTYEPLACEASINELLNNGFITYPNPSKDEINLHVDATTISSYQIIDFQGRVVLSADVNNLALVKANISKLNAGTYLVKVVTPFGTAQRSIVIE